MLGHKLFQALRERFTNVVGTARQDPTKGPLSRVDLLKGPDVIAHVDVMNIDELTARLRSWEPEFVVNCAGVIKQRAEALSAIPSITVNSLLPHRLAESVSGWGGRLIHFSTDCVFSGRRGCYREDDFPDAEDLYGRTKYLGEVVGPNAITLRSSIIGRELSHHRSLLDWFLAQRGRRIRGFRRVLYSGITTNEMANVVCRIVSEGASVSGRYQVVSEPISKYDLLCLLRAAYGIDVEIAPDDSEISDRSMVGELFRSATGYVAPSWSDLVTTLASDPTPYGEWGISLV
jgi:dTDP-4-dehydrorhamnose reductase